MVNNSLYTNNYAFSMSICGLYGFVTMSSKSLSQRNFSKGWEYAWCLPQVPILCTGMASTVLACFYENIRFFELHTYLKMVTDLLHRLMSLISASIVMDSKWQNASSCS